MAVFVEEAIAVDGDPATPATSTAFLRYLELNPVRAGLVQRAIEWPWSSARVHCADLDPDQLVCFDRWQHVFRRPETIAVDWHRYLDQVIEAERANRAWLRLHSSGSGRNRPLAWSGLLVCAAGMPPPDG